MIVTIAQLLTGDRNVSPEFREALADVIEEPRDVCEECKVLRAVGHSPWCSQEPPLPRERYGKDGFVRDSAGRIAGLNGGRYE